MRTQYLHISAYSCDRCRGPVISGSTAVRGSEISKETEVKQVGAICLSCGHRQSKVGTAAHATFHQFNGT
jgi:RNase P subunit RPR2